MKSNKNQSKNKEERGILRYIDWTLIITLIILVLYVHINGFYINKEIYTIETCNGHPTNNTLIQELQDKGIITKTIEVTPWNNQNITNQQNYPGYREEP